MALAQAVNLRAFRYTDERYLGRCTDPDRTNCGPICAQVHEMVGFAAAASFEKLCRIVRAIKLQPARKG